MTSIFHTKIRQSLADEGLQSALDANAEKRITVRQIAFASLSDPQAMRQQARAVRADVIANLDHYLDQFTRNLLAHGVKVHRAASASEAVQIVLEIAKSSNAKLIAKSKTMVSEEIGLNDILEAAGLRVVETDLGEFIVQIRHEPPSHIITPAVHLRRADVGRTFHEQLGIPYTDDIPTMTAAARRVLREVFLTADIGISGVNFGVAETGTVCVVTNEGNGRMVTTLPPVHIALMGMERLVPTLDDLALMLNLLPRSATGQKLSVYTNLINAPRSQDDPDGPQERHIIILDNGRSRVRQSSVAEILYCIRCGACLNACPVFREIGGHAYVSKAGKYCSYPGPMGSVISPALFGPDEFSHLARASTLCGACKEACPVDIDLPGLLLRVRAGMVAANRTLDSSQQEKTRPSIEKPNPPGWLALGLRVFSWSAVSPKRFHIAQRLAALAGRLGSMLTFRHNPASPAWLQLPKFTGWGLGKDFPMPASRSFHQRWKTLSLPALQVSSYVTHRSSDTPIEQVSEHVIPDKLEAFSAELTALGASLSVCSEQELTVQVLAIIAAHNTSQILAWSVDRLPFGLLDNLAQAGIEVLHPTSQTKDMDSRVRVGLTGVSAAIAETGTILLTSGAGQSLSTSLLPEIHIAVLFAQDLHENLREVLTCDQLRQSSAAVLITGPSRTADIEMTLTIGVHGPGELHVIYVC